MKSLNIVYIDDDIDTGLSRFLATTLKDYKLEVKSLDDPICFTYNEIEFRSSQDYKSLINNNYVSDANIIIIDNRLFIENSRFNNVFTGKEFMLIMKKISPFIETLIITQNNELDGLNVIHKFSGKNCNREQIDEYYKNQLMPKIDFAAESIINFFIIFNELKNSKSIDPVLIDKIHTSLENENVYKDISKNDIDDLITILKDVYNEVTK